jgi:hypothetical protein
MDCVAGLLLLEEVKFQNNEIRKRSPVLGRHGLAGCNLVDFAKTRIVSCIKLASILFLISMVVKTGLMCCG